MDGEVEASNLIDFPESVLNESEANVKSESQLSSWRELNFEELSYASNTPRLEPKHAKGVKNKAEENKKLSLNDNNYRFQDINLFEYSKHLVGLKCVFEEYLGKSIFNYF